MDSLLQIEIECGPLGPLILAIEDDPATLKGIVETLPLHGLHVIAATTWPAAAECLVRDVRTKIARAREANPQFTAASAVVAGAETDGIYVFGTADPKNQLLQELGFTFPDSLAEVGKDEGSYGGYISFERTDEVDLDAVVWLLGEDELLELNGELWQQTRAAKTGRGIFIDDTGAYYTAQNMVTVLSIPYLLNRYVPQLAAAVDGDPSTRVPVPA